MRGLERKGGARLPAHFAAGPAGELGEPFGLELGFERGMTRKQQRAGMAARQLLRRAERLEGAGAVLLSGHPALEAQLRPEWLAELARRTGCEVRWEARPGLAIEAPQAQLVPR